MNQRTGLDRKYREWSDEYLDKEYKKGVDKLLVFQQNVTDEKVKDLNEKYEKLEKENEEMKRDMELLKLKLDVKKLKNGN